MNGTKKPSRRPRTREKGTPFPTAILIGLATALGIGLLLLLIFTLFLYRAADPVALSGILSLVALYIGCAAGGFVTMKRTLDASGYSACGIAALATSALALAFCLICDGSGKGVISTIGYYAGIFAAFFAGAFLGRKRKAHPKSRRKR